MKDPLAILHRLAGWRIEGRQRALAGAHERLRALVAQRDGLATALAVEAALAGDDAAMLAAWATYAAHTRGRLAAAESQIDGARAALSEATASLRDEFAASKRLELLLRRRQQARRAEADRLVQAELDDLGQRRERRTRC